MQRRTSLAALAAALLPMRAARAASGYPNRAVRLVVGFAPGGAVDELARMVAERLGSRLGQPVVVENKPGAASTLAGEFVANAAADGHTLLFTGTSMLIARHLQGRAGADLSRFAPVAGIAASPLVIAVNPAFPARDPQGFVQELRARPGKYFYATSGVGSLHHLGMELLKKQLGLKVEHVPYKGASQILPDLISGQIQIGIVSANAVTEHDKAGKLRVVGLMNAGDWPGQPQWRSMASVAPGFDVMSRMFVLAPAAVPGEVVQELDAVLAQILRAPELAQAFAAQGAVPRYAGREALRTGLLRENASWSELVKSLNIKEN